MPPNVPSQGKPPPGKGEDIVVFITRHEGKCSECKEEFFKGNFIRVENGNPLCLDCADLGHLEFLPRGNVAVTRRATKHSPLRAVVVERSRSRQRARAAERREAQEPAFVAAVTDAIRALFPGCPADEAARIAGHACEKHSGRVGRTAAAKQLDSEPLRLAVIAHIRHEHTSYDRFLMRHGDRQLARQEVRAKIDEVLARWEGTRR